MVSLVIGQGEIGSSLYSFLKDKEVKVYSRDIKDAKVPKPDILHICIPYSETFSDAVSAYIKQYKPKVTIVYSTLPIGTCEAISESIVHSPVEGRHPALTAGFDIFPRWLGAKDVDSLKEAYLFWHPLVKALRSVDSARQTEMLKLRSTAKYGINLVWADYEKSLTDAVGSDFDMLKVYDLDYNYLYEKTGWPQFSRYLLDPPNGEIGGHCIVPNAKMLNEQYPNGMLDMIIKMEKK